METRVKSEKAVQDVGNRLPFPLNYQMYRQILAITAVILIIAVITPKGVKFPDWGFISIGLLIGIFVK